MRFIAYWKRGAEHANIKIDSYAVEEGLVKLFRNEPLNKDNTVGVFDMGFLDAWYVTEESQ